ncbi:MAG: mechanosensitive ion channel family protein [Proteobacteria bacterium]|nr:mechanosensitive ion channel family protein [Pseudomonadota bacterium]
MNYLEPTFAVLQRTMAWAPPWAFGLVLAAVSALAAIGLYAFVERVALRLLKKRGEFWHPFIARVRGVVRAAFVLTAINLALQSPLFPATLKTISAQVFWVALVVLIGRTSLVAVDVGAALHVLRYRIDIDDNLFARIHLTQVKILKHTVNTLIYIVTAATAMMAFDTVRQFGVSLFASAGVAGIAIGLAARPVLSNIIAGLQIAITQPIRIDDVVVVENEFGNVEDIGGAFVVIRLWDLRRLVVPLSYFIEKPFQNYTRADAALLAPVTFQLDPRVPVAVFRAKAENIVKDAKLWDGKVFTVQVTELKDENVEIRILVSAKNSGAAWDLRCDVREKMLTWLQDELAWCLPHRRQEVISGAARADLPMPMPPRHAILAGNAPQTVDE